MRRSVYGLLSLLVAACGTDGNTTLAPATLGGTIEGSAFTAADAIAGTASTRSFGTTGPRAYVAITSTSGACVDLTANVLPRGADLMLLTFATVDANLNSTMPTVGDYRIVGPNDRPGPGNSAVADFQEMNPVCGMPNFVNIAVSVSGTLHLTSANANGYAGDGDVTFGSGDHLTFSFIAPTCTGFADAIAADKNPTCQ